MIVYVDIDGTLTSEDVANGPVIDERIRGLRKLLAEHEVVMWSARGTQYVEEFCRRNHLAPDVMIGKPDLCIDDKPTIRKGGLTVKPPEFLDR